MRLRTKRALTNLAIFAVVLVLIILLGSSSSSGGKTFAWNTIRYKTTATSLPEARGVCPGLHQSSKPALVVSRVADDGDPKWLDSMAEKYHICVYTADAPADSKTMHLQVPANRGHEAMAYLTFMIDNYDDIPDAGAVFVHGSRFAWHNDDLEYDNAKLLARLNVSAALQPLGYYNLRCDWSASTCATDYGPAQGSYETALNAKMQPWDARAVSDAALPRALASLFGGDSSDKAMALGRGDALRAQCCAQFVVGRERIQQHSRDEYGALRQWLLDGSSNAVHGNNDAAPADDRIAGRILSYLWHVIFVPLNGANTHGLDQLNAIACPTAAECYCRLYGLCDLKSCINPGHCYGQYAIPADFTLPKDWAATHQ